MIYEVFRLYDFESRKWLLVSSARREKSKKGEGL